VEFSFEALEEAAAGFQRIEGYLHRAADVCGAVHTGSRAPEFDAALDDDLGTPAAMAVIYDAVREGNKLLGGGDTPALRENAASVQAMLEVLGLDPFEAHWSAGGKSGTEERLTAAVSSLVGALLERRTAARAAKDFATADAIRDQLKGAGIELEDTPQGPKWTLA